MVSEKDKDPRWPISMDVACDLVQKLLVQLTLNDSPPVNDNIQPSSARPLPEIHKRRKNRDSNLQEQGHVAITNLCIQTLEKFGRQPYKGNQLNHLERQSEDLLPHKKSCKWIKNKWKFNSSRNDIKRLTRNRYHNNDPDPDKNEGEASEYYNVNNSQPIARLQLFGSEYARFLSTTPLAPKYSSIQNKRPLRRTRKHNIQNIEDADSSVITGPITDIIVTQGEGKLLVPKGYYRVSRSPSEEPFFLGNRKSNMFLCVKKEKNWDRAAQRPCVTAVSFIFPDRKEFVPPGFSLVRLSTPNQPPANLNKGGSEPVYLCFRRSREGNPLTGIIPLFPSKRESIPEGYTVLERSPRNFVACLNASDSPIFLAYRQRIANLESLRPPPLLLSVISGESNTARLESYYSTGGTVVHNSRVGRFHIMDRSTHSLLSPSSITNRLSLIEASRKKSLGSIQDLTSSANGEKYSYSGSTSIHNTNSPQKSLSSSLILTQDLKTPESLTTMSDSDRQSSSAEDFDSEVSCSDLNRSFTSLQLNNSCRGKHFCISSKDNLSSFRSIHAHDNKELCKCLEALSFIPTVSHKFQNNDVKGIEEFQMRVTILLPVLTSCYVRHGGSALVAVEGLNDLLCQDFYSDDVDMSQDPSTKSTLLDISIQVVCDVATTGAHETQLYACVEFVENAVKYGCGYLSTRTIGYVLRFYLFAFYFGISSPIGNWICRNASDSSDSYVLEDPRLTVQRFNLPGGAPQIAILSLKDMILLMFARLGSQVHLDQHSFLMRKQDDESSKENTDNSIFRVDIANFTELAMHQIIRSGGSEIFWYEMINLCGSGLFGNDKVLRQETRDMYSICFAILANCVKVAFSKIRKNKRSISYPRDIANKLMALEMIKLILVTWERGAISQDVSGSYSVSSFTFCIRRLVVPCLLTNTPEALDDPRIFRRIIQIIAIFWRSSIYRKFMKLELSILFNHFILKLLEVGPQILFKSGKNRTYLFAQQIELLKELKCWFSTDTDRLLLELYLNYDADYRIQHVGDGRELPPWVQWKLFEQLCSLLCNLSENCTQFLVDKIKESQSTSSTSRSARAKNRINMDYDGTSTVALARESAKRLRNAALETILQIVKLLARSVTHSLGTQFFSLIEAWCCGRKYIREKSEIPLKEKDDPGLDSAPVIKYWQQSGITKGAFVNKNELLKRSASKKIDLNASVTETKNNLNTAFNIARKKGLNKAIDYLIACNVLQYSPRDISSFLRIHREDLDSSDLGKYLGEGGSDPAEADFWNLIRFNYIRAISFIGMNVEEGLRHLLTQGGFLLPGEAQQIDRIIASFARCYWEDNAGDIRNCPIEDEDTIFILSFAVIMLNTDLHKSNQTKKGKKRSQIKHMSKDEFINNLRGVNKGNEIDRSYLSNIYDGIETDPIALQHIADRNEPEVFEQYNSMNDNVQNLDALLRGLAIQDYRFISLQDYCDVDFVGDIESATINISRNLLMKTWHQFHGLINSALKIAHLDPNGMEVYIDLLKFILGLTILLDMPIQAVAFLDQLGRFCLFNAWRNKISDSFAAFQDQDSYKEETWYKKMTKNFIHFNEASNFVSNNRKFESMIILDGVINELSLTFTVDAVERKVTKEAIERLENSEYLLNDPTRSFVREGNLLKRANRSGRDVEYRFFLFSDVLIYAKRIPGSSPTNYRIHEELPLILMKIVDWFPKDESKQAIQVYHPRKTFLVLCSTPEERTSWVTDIRESIVKEVERKVASETARKAAANVPINFVSVEPSETTEKQVQL